MKKSIVIFCLSLLCASSLNADPVHKTTLKNGLTVGVEACSSDIFRIRITSADKFEESLLERYGIVKTDWPSVDVREKKTSGEFRISTERGAVVIDRSTGSVKVLSSDGSAIVRDISFKGPSSPLCNKLSGIINERFADLHVTSNGGIIGDDDGTLSEKDKAESGDPAKSSVLAISLEEGERFYGGGGTSREHIQHRGELLRMHTSYQHTEIPVTFVMSSRGWGIFNNTTRKNFFDIGNTDAKVFNIYNTAPYADFYIFLGDDMPGVLDRYTQVTGRTYILPKWAYGLCFGPNMREDQFAILNDAFNFRQVDVPCDVLWLEPQWMEKRYDFSMEKNWNFEKFSPEPYWVQDKYPKQLHNRLFIGKLRSMGYHLGLWLCEEYDLSITEEDAIAEREGRATSGEPHWMDHLTTFLDYGVEGFKLDPARTIDEHTYRKYYNGRTDKEMHNLDQVLLPKQMAQMTRKHTGKRSWHHYCGGWSGVQHWGASTSGDNGGGKTALFDQLNLGMSGYMNTSCDVMSVPRDQEMQSLHFGAFLPWMQINSWFSMMQPFYYDDFEQTLYRNSIKTRYELMPYLYSTALEGFLTGMPIVRAMPLVFPEDRNVDDMAYQYMFGPNLCVGIFTNEIYLPAGQWTDAWTGEKIVSKGETIVHEYPEDRAGLLFVREGAIIPCQQDVKYIGTKPVDSFILKVYPHGQSSYTMYDSDAESYGYEAGQIAATRFDCKQSDGAVELTINPVQGSFENMPQSRSFDLEVAIENKPGQVSVNGSSVSGWDWKDGVLRYIIDSVAAGDKITVIIR